ncbi:MAG: hypothetical protein II255_02970 [Ruminiclostridium sp.]|nr:hypothetical protein [Ruminiclostridium sp.]
MKRTLAALLGLTLTLTLTACGDTDKPAEVPQEETEQVTQPAEDPALTNLRQDLEAKGSTCAVGYLGTLPESGSAKALLEDSGCLEDYPFLKDAAVVAHEGYQAFYMIPRDAQATVLVQEYICDESNDYQGEVGETLYEGENGQPVILFCNYNDVLPNLLVTLEGADGESFSYSPVLELCGGTVFIPAGAAMTDLSDYEAIPQPESPPAPAAVDFTGSWRTYEDFEGYEVVLDMIFGEDGSAEYLNGYRDSEYLSDYQGTWYTITENGQYPAGSIVLDMKDAFSGAPFFGVFTVTADSGTITLTHVSGDTLVYGTDGQGITFSPRVY